LRYIFFITAIFFLTDKFAFATKAEQNSPLRNVELIRQVLFGRDGAGGGEFSNAKAGDSRESPESADQKIFRKWAEPWVDSLRQNLTTPSKKEDQYSRGERMDSFSRTRTDKTRSKNDDRMKLKENHDIKCTDNTGTESSRDKRWKETTYAGKDRRSDHSSEDEGDDEDYYDYEDAPYDRRGSFFDTWETQYADYDSRDYPCSRSDQDSSKGRFMNEGDDEDYSPNHYERRDTSYENHSHSDSIYDNPDGTISEKEESEDKDDDEEENDEETSDKNAFDSYAGAPVAYPLPGIYPQSSDAPQYAQQTGVYATQVSGYPPGTIGQATYGQPIVNAYPQTNRYSRQNTQLPNDEDEQQETEYDDDERENRKGTHSQRRRDDYDEDSRREDDYDGNSRSSDQYDSSESRGSHISSGQRYGSTHNSRKISRHTKDSATLKDSQLVDEENEQSPNEEIDATMEDEELTDDLRDETTAEKPSKSKKSRFKDQEEEQEEGKGDPDEKPIKKSKKTKQNSRETVNSSDEDEISSASEEASETEEENSKGKSKQKKQIRKNKRTIKSDSDGGGLEEEILVSEDEDENDMEGQVTSNQNTSSANFSTSSAKETQTPLRKDKDKSILHSEDF
jgi:hypothetical protein